MGLHMRDGIPYGGVDPRAIKWSEAERSVKKNLCNSKNIYTNSGNSITATVNDDGSVTLNGTASSGNFYFTVDNIDVGAGSYYVSGGVDGSTNDNYKLYAQCDDTGGRVEVSVYSSTANELMVIPYGNAPIRVQIVVRNGQTVSNLTFKPMVRLASILDDTYTPYISDNVELQEQIDDKTKATTLAVDLTNWTQDTTSQSGSTLYKKQISLNHAYVDCPNVDIGASGVLPTTAEQEAYNLIQYVTVDSAVPCLYLYASDIPTTAFYINVIGVD